MNSLAISIPSDLLADFCRKWQLTEFAIFGSALRDDFSPESDVDVMVTFHPSAAPTLLTMNRMQQELADLFGRSVDLVTRSGVESSRNEHAKRAILSSARALYAA